MAHDAACGPWRALLVFLGLFLILCGAAFCINLALRRASNGEINLFFVGPANNPLIVF